MLRQLLGQARRAALGRTDDDERGEPAWHGVARYTNCSNLDAPSD